MGSFFKSFLDLNFKYVRSAPVNEKTKIYTSIYIKMDSKTLKMSRKKMNCLSLGPLSKVDIVNEARVTKTSGQKFWSFWWSDLLIKKKKKHNS